MLIAPSVLTSISTVPSVANAVLFTIEKSSFSPIELNVIAHVSSSTSLATTPSTIPKVFSAACNSSTVAL